MAATMVPGTWAVPNLFRERLGSGVGRQRYMEAEGHLLLVLHAPPKPDETRREGRFFWRAADGSWTSDDLGTGAAALMTHLDQYEDVINRLDRLEEKATTADEYFQVLEQLAPVFRSARNTYVALDDARKACPQYRELIDVRDRAYDIQRTAELLYDGTRNALEFAVARRAEEQAAASHRMAVSAHRLNLLAAFFFPIATLSAVFGVNLKHGWEEMPPPFYFLGLILAGLLCGGVLTMFITQNSGQAGDRPTR
jgi:Mg2+ and Co2+ transporter CorA